MGTNQSVPCGYDARTNRVWVEVVDGVKAELVATFDAAKKIKWVGPVVEGLLPSPAGP